jgi:hypothetical protein
MKSIFLLSTAIAWAQSGGTFTATSNMIAARLGHTATLLPNGKVLIAGGGTSSAELFNPTTGSFTPTGDMITSRRFHTATLLPDGRVLVVSGFIGDIYSNSVTTSAEIYDPASGTFTALGDVSRSTQQAVHTATLLSNGKVLIAGIGPNARLFDPADSTFADTGPYIGPTPWSVTTATLLADDRVLITGCIDVCYSGLSQIYDPVTNSFTATGGLNQCPNGTKLQPDGRICWFIDLNTATLLLDGKVLIAGSDEGAEPADTEVYDQSSGIFTPIGNTAAPHEFSTATLLPDGTVLIAGSQLPGGFADPTVEIYDPATSRFAVAGDMIGARYSHTATLLPDGRVLIAGGNSSSTAEIYHPAVLVPSPVLYTLAGGMQGAIWHITTGEIASSNNPAVAGEVLAMYTNNLIEGGVIPPQVVIGGRLGEVLYFGDAPGCPGLYQVNFRVPNGVAPGSAVAVHLTYIERPSNESTIGLR